MKEFNIEFAKQGKPVCTRNGKSVRILCFDKKSERKDGSIVALIETDKSEQLFTYNDDGKYTMSEEEHPLDLMMATEKKEGWMPVAWFGEKKIGLLIFDTKEKAKAYYKDDEDVCIVDIIPVEWEE